MRSNAAAMLLLALACNRAPDTSPKPQPSTSATELGEPPGARMVASVVASVRSRELRIAAPAWQLQPLAFGRDLLVRLTDERVEVYSMPQGTLAFEVPVVAARGAVEIAGGSVVVVASAASLRIDPKAKEPVRLSAIPFLPGTVLLPDRRNSASLWSVHSAGGVLSRHTLLLSGKGGVEAVVSLDDYDGGPVTVMRDGVLLYRAPDGVRRAMPGARSRSLRSELTPWRLLPGRRVDQAWAVGEDGRVELWQIGDTVRVVRRYSLGFPPFDVAANSEFLAAVTVEEGAGTPRRFGLVVLSETGDEVLRESLPERPPSDGERWATLAGRDRHVVLSEHDGLVAVGGPDSLRVLRIADRSTLLSR